MQDENGWAENTDSASIAVDNVVWNEPPGPNTHMTCMSFRTLSSAMHTMHEQLLEPLV